MFIPHHIRFNPIYLYRYKSINLYNEWGFYHHRAIAHFPSKRNAMDYINKTLLYFLFSTKITLNARDHRLHHDNAQPHGDLLVICRKKNRFDPRKFPFIFHILIRILFFKPRFQWLVFILIVDPLSFWTLHLWRLFILSSFFFSPPPTP